MENVDAMRDAQNNTAFEWEDPIPFDENKIAPFPIDILPDWLRNYVIALGKQLQVPPDMPALASITALSTALSGKFEAYSPATDWAQSLNTYIIQAAAPGSNKSAVHDAIMKPVMDFEKEHHEKNEDKLNDKRQEYRALTKRLEKMEKDYGNKPTPELMDEMKALNKEIAEIAKMIKKPTFVTGGNITTEKLYRLLDSSGEKLTISTDEGFELINIITGKYSGKIDIDLILNAYNGGRSTMERVTSTSVVLKKPLLTIGMFVQPSVLQEFQHFNGRGLSERFLYGLPNVQYHKGFGEAVPDMTTFNYNNAISALLSLEEKEVRIKVGESASEQFEQLYDYTKREAFNPDNPEVLQGWYAKLAGTLLRIVTLLHIAEEMAVHGKVVSKKLANEDIGKAFALLPFFVDCANAAFGIASGGGEQKDLRYTLKRIAEKFAGKEIINHQDLWQSVRRKFKKAENLDQVLYQLEDMNYIRNVLIGRKKIIHINPLFLKDGKSAPRVPNGDQSQQPQGEKLGTPENLDVPSVPNDVPRSLTRDELGTLGSTRDREGPSEIPWESKDERHLGTLGTDFKQNETSTLVETDGEDILI